MGCEPIGNSPANPHPISGPGAPKLVARAGPSRQPERIDRPSPLPWSVTPGADGLSMTGCPMPLPPGCRSPQPRPAPSVRKRSGLRARSGVRTHREPCCEPSSLEGPAEPTPGVRARLPWQRRRRGRLAFAYAPACCSHPADPSRIARTCRRMFGIDPRPICRRPHTGLKAVRVALAPHSCRGGVTPWRRSLAAEVRLSAWCRPAP